MKKLNPKAVWVFFISNVFRFLFFVFFVAFFALGFTGEFLDLSFLLNINWLWLLVPLYLLLCYGWAYLTFQNYKYDLLDTGFRMERGVIIKKYVTIPYDRIQNVDINRGIMARLLGLSDLHIQTAGASASVGRYGAMGAGSEGLLTGVSSADAEMLRDNLLSYITKSKNQGI